MKSITTIIVTVPERLWMAKGLIYQLSREGTGSEFILHVHEPGTLPRVDFPAAMGKAFGAGHEWILQLEDDVSLCPNFGRHLSESLPWIRDNVDCATFFSRSRKDLDAMKRGERWRRIAPKAFSMSQCFIVRSSLLDGFNEWYPEWYSDNPQHERAADLLFGAWLSIKGARVAVHIPSLVQHKLGRSTIPGHYGARQSQSFEQAFGGGCQ